MNLEQIVAALILIGLGMLLCFFGYRFFKVLLPAWAFIVGFGAGAGFVSIFAAEGFLGTTLGWIVALVAGVLFAYLAYAIYALGVYLLAGSLGYGLAVSIVLALGYPYGQGAAAAGIAGALLAAIIAAAVNAPHLLVALMTAAAGATTLLSGISILTGDIVVSGIGSGQAMRGVFQRSWIWMAGWLVLFVVGLLYQRSARQD